MFKSEAEDKKLQAKSVNGGQQQCVAHSAGQCLGNNRKLEVLLHSVLWKRRKWGFSASLRGMKTHQIWLLQWPNYAHLSGDYARVNRPNVHRDSKWISEKWIQQNPPVKRSIFVAVGITARFLTQDRLLYIWKRLLAWNSLRRLLKVR